MGERKDRRLKTMNHFLQSWAEAVSTSVGFFWMALWAFALGYLISSLVEVLVTQERMQKTMGESGDRFQPGAVDHF